MRVLVMKKIRKSMIWAAVILLLVILSLSVWYGWSQGPRAARVDHTNAMQVSKPVAVEPAAMPNSDFFTEYRMERDRLRSERSEVLRDAIRTAKSEDARQKAQDSVLKMVVEKQREAEMENLIKAKGFSDALVFVRDNSVSAVVKAPALSRDEVVQVADVISRVSGVKQEDITISAKP